MVRAVLQPQPDGVHGLAGKLRQKPRVHPDASISGEAAAKVGFELTVLRRFCGHYVNLCKLEYDRGASGAEVSWSLPVAMILLRRFPAKTAAGEVLSAIRTVVVVLRPPQVTWKIISIVSQSTTSQ